MPGVVRAQEVPLQREQLHPLRAYERNMGLSRECEEGKRHRKRGDVLFRAFPSFSPANAEDLPMGHILSLVFTAKLRGLLPMPDSFLESRAGFGFLVRAGGVPCFIEDLVALSRDGRPATATLCHGRRVATRAGWVGSDDVVGDRSSGRPRS
jgi:hypothetical protein